MIGRIRRYIENFEEFDIRYFLRNSFWMLLLRGVVMTSGLVISVVFARLATKSAFGQYNLFISIFSLLAILTIPGTATVVLRDVSREKESVFSRAVNYRLRWGIITVPVVLAIGLYLHQFRDRALGMAVVAAALVYPVYYATVLWKPVFEAKQEFSRRSIYQGSSAVVRLVAVVGVIYVTDGDPLLVFIAYLVMKSATNCLFLYSAFDLISEVGDLDPDWKRSSIKLSFVNVMYTLYDHVDKVALAFFLTPAELAIYSVAVAIGNATRSGVDNVLRIYYPSIFSEDNEAIMADIKQSMPVVTVITAGFLMIMAALLPWLIPALYTVRYSQSILFAQLYLLIIPLYIAVSIASTLLVNFKYEQWYNIVIFISALVNVGLYTVLIPEIGILGGIIGSIGYFAVQLVLEVWVIVYRVL